MDLYTQNIALLRKKLPNIEELLKGASHGSSVEVINNAPSGLPSLYYTNGTGQKVLLHSLYNPLKEAYTLVHAKDLSNTSLVVILGFGFGYHLKQLLKHPFYIGDIYVIEPSLDILRAALMHCDLQDIFSDARVHLFVEPNINKIKDVIDSDPLFSFKIVKTEYLQLPVYRQIFKDYFCQVSEAINLRFSMNSVSVFVAAELAQNWDRNSIENLQYTFNTPPLSRFKSAFSGKPALLVAAGPSLDKNVQYIKQIKSKALVICVGTALKALLRAGITPDFVVALDSSDVTLPQFEGIADTSGMWLFADIATPPKIVKMFYPRVSFYTGMHNVLVNNFFPAALAKTMYFHCAGSVSNIALHLSRFFGCNPVVFMGLDLAIGDSGHSHAQGTMHQDHLLIPEKDQPFFVTVKGNYTAEVKTPQNFYIYLRWTEHFIKSHPEMTFINASAGGAHIEGSVVMSIDNVIEQYLKNSSVCVNTVCAHAKVKGSKQITRHILSRILKTKKDLVGLDKYFKQGAVLADKMVRIINGKKSFRSPKLEKKFSGEVKKFFLRLGSAKNFVIFSHTAQVDVSLMIFNVNQYRVHEKGFGEAIMKLPGLFKKLQATSKQFQKQFKIIQAYAKIGDKS